MANRLKFIKIRTGIDAEGNPIYSDNIPVSTDASYIDYQTTDGNIIDLATLIGNMSYIKEGDIKTQIAAKASKEALAQLNTRIANLVLHANESTSKDAELIDLRNKLQELSTSDNPSPAQTAGDAVREQLAVLLNSIDELKDINSDILSKIEEVGVRLNLDVDTSTLYLLDANGKQLGDGVVVATDLTDYINTGTLAGILQSYATNTDLNNLATTVENLSPLNNLSFEFTEETSELSWYDGEDLLGSVIITGTGGGSGSGANNVSLKMTYIGNSGISTLFENVENPNDRTPIYLSFNWSSVYTDDSSATGPGTIIVNNNSVRQTSMNISQGQFDFNIAPYLSKGNNNVQIILTDNTGLTRNLRWTVNAVSLDLSSTFDDTVAYYKSAGNIPYVYTLTTGASFSVTMNYVLNGKVTVVNGIPQVNGGTRYTEVKTSFGGLSTYALPPQDHGAHSLDVFAQATVNEVTIYSTVLHYEIISVERNNNSIIIASSFNRTNLNQYEVVDIPYIIWNPNYSSTYYDNVGSNYSYFQLQVRDLDTNTEWNTASGHSEYPIIIRPDRSLQHWSFVPPEAHNYRLRIYVGENNVRSFDVSVVESSVSFVEVTDGLIAKFTTEGKDNSSVNYNTWESERSDATGQHYLYKFTFPSNFDWINGGWQSAEEKDGSKVLTIKANSTKTNLNLPLFENDSYKTTGKTIKLVFRAKNCINYDATLLDCYDGNDADSSGNTENRTGQGLKIYANRAIFDTKSRKIEIPFKEDSKVEMDIVVYPVLSGSLIIIYLNGVPCAAQTYDSGDTFAQTNVKNILLGSSDCDLDIYLIKVYNRMLSPYEILNNFVMDAPTNKEKDNRYSRNNIFDDQQNIVIDKLDVPYMVIESNSDSYDLIFPTVKLKNRDNPPVRGDISYFDPSNHRNDWKVENAGIGMQGTSSAGYGRAALNLDIDLQNGLQYVNKGTVEYTYQLSNNSIPVDYFNLKADVASSEGANNVLLTDEYNLYDPYISDPQLDNLEAIARARNDYGYEDFNPNRPSNIKTYDSSKPAQTKAQRAAEVNYLTVVKGYKPQVRGTIEGKPIIVFHKNTGTIKDTSTRFYGKFNMNNSKNNFEVFGEDKETYPQQCCVEFLTNSSAYCLFNADDFTSTELDDDGETIYSWEKGLEFRYPKKYTQTDVDNLARVFKWVKSTNPAEATNAVLSPSVTYGTNTYTRDNAAYRYAKFRNELEDYFVLDSVLWLYLFTEQHLMVDNRAKNVFMTTDDGIHWHFKNDYDNDTALGIDNIGRLRHSYDVEYRDGSEAFGGESSVLWTNLEHEFRPEIISMYNEKEAEGVWNSTRLINKFNSYQESWPEAIWIEDMFKKYINPYINPLEGQAADSTYLPMLLGDKKLQRAWFLYYREKYISSKYDNKTTTIDQVQMRITVPSNVSVVKPNQTLKITPYINMYVSVRFGANGELVKKKALRNEVVEIIPTSFDDSGSGGVETFIHNASMLNDLGDLSALYLSMLDISQATRLRKLQIGNNTTGYNNRSWATNAEINFNSVLIEEINLNGVSTYSSAINLSKCTGLKIFEAQNTLIPYVIFASHSLIQTLRLPSTINSLALVETANLKTLNIQTDSNGEYPEIYRLIGDKVPTVIDEILRKILIKCPKLLGVRLIDVEWEIPASEDGGDGHLLFEKLKTVYGIDANGNQDTSKGRTNNVSGTLNLATLAASDLSDYTSRWPKLRIFFNTRQFSLTYKNYDGTILGTELVANGSNGTNPNQLIGTPSKPSDELASYTFAGWVNEDTSSSETYMNVTENRTLIATYTRIPRKYNVYLFNENYDTVKDNPNLHSPWKVLANQDAGKTLSLVEYENQLKTSNLFTGGWIIVSADGWSNSSNIFPTNADNINFNELSYYNSNTINSVIGTVWCFLVSSTIALPSTSKTFGQCTMGEIQAVLKSGSINNYWELGESKEFVLNPDENGNKDTLSLTIVKENSDSIDLLMTNLSKDGYYYNKNKKFAYSYEYDGIVASSDTEIYTCEKTNSIIKAYVSTDGAWGGRPLISKITNVTQSKVYNFNNNRLPAGLSASGELIFNAAGFVEIPVGSSITIPATVGNQIKIETFIKGKSWNNGGWYLSDIRTDANNDFYNLLPIELQRMMIPKTRKSTIGNYVSTVSYEYGGDIEHETQVTFDESLLTKHIIAGNDEDNYITSEDLIWLPNDAEISVIAADANKYPIYAKEGSTFAIFVTDADRKKKSSELATNKKCKLYFLSTTYTDYNNSVGAVNEDGEWQEGLAAYSTLPCAFGLTLGVE